MWRLDVFAGAVEVDQPDRSLVVDQNVVGIEIGVPDLARMKRGDGARDVVEQPVPFAAFHQQQRRQRLRLGNQAGQQVGTIGQSVTLIARRHGHRHRQALLVEPLHDPEFVEGARAFRTLPEIAVANEMPRQAAPPVASMHQRPDATCDHPHVAAPALQPAPVIARLPGEPLRRIGIDGSCGKQHFAAAFAVAMFGNTHAETGLPARLRQSNKSLRARVIAPPDSLCILRLSALGDVSHVVPLIRTVQRHWPGTALTWIVGQFEARLVGDIPGVEFIPYDKRSGWRGLSGLRRRLRGRRFDALLLMQLALRANLVSSAVRADVRVGYDRPRSKEGHSLFINRRIPARSGQHVLDALGSFLEPLGLPADEPPHWALPIPDEAEDFARQQLPDDGPRTLIISPCASHPLRNWLPERYAAVAEHAVRRHGLRVLLCGGPSPAERAMGDAILGHCRVPVLDLIGRDTIKRALALLRRADLVLSPDSGPVHMANAVGTPVLGLYAATDPQRSGPYSDRRWCVDRYAQAAERLLGKPATQLPWGRKIEVPGVMALIDTAAVIERLDAWALEYASTP